MRKYLLAALILLAVVTMAFWAVRWPVTARLSFVASTNLTGTNIFIFQPEETKQILGNQVGWGGSAVTVLPIRGGHNSDPFTVARIPQEPLGYPRGFVAVGIPNDLAEFRVRLDRTVRDGWASRGKGFLQRSICVPWTRIESFISEPVVQKK